MGAEAIKRLLQDYDVEAEGEALRETIENGKGTKRLKAIKRLKVVVELRRGPAPTRWAWCWTRSRSSRRTSVRWSSWTVAGSPPPT